jgi:hypothetical protein
MLEGCPMNGNKKEVLELRKELIRTQRAYLIQQRQLNELQMDKLALLEKELISEENDPDSDPNGIATDVNNAWEARVRP